ncbi:nickel insertion protein [Clostridiisalibacter paucivorans]|uniref:nickel insertion protein n=1 Tax=Clostridiisalibacter paucivorans TaxID=408753 RepID=UPI000553857A|nr:nickel insertion protein [Clostridiisalibacter paucivorans]
MNPEYYSYIMPKLLEEGAKDVYMANIMMKKNRPAIKLTVLCESDDVKNMEDILFKETSTLGIRRYKVKRTELERKFIKIKTKFGLVTLKLGYKEGKILKYSPEYQECQEIAKGFDIPINKVYKEIIHSAKKYFEVAKLYYS